MKLINATSMTRLMDKNSRIYLLVSISCVIIRVQVLLAFVGSGLRKETPHWCRIWA